MSSRKSLKSDHSEIPRKETPQPKAFSQEISAATEHSSMHYGLVQNEEPEE